MKPIMRLNYAIVTCMNSGQTLKRPYIVKSVTTYKLSSLGGGVRCPTLVWHSYDICQNSQTNFTNFLFLLCFDVTLKKLNMYWNNVINEKLKILLLIRIFLIFLNNKLINKIKCYLIYSGVSVLCFLHYRCQSVLSCRGVRVKVCAS
jgi:hypothetical protein